jgi:outer membrane usher protein
MGSRRTFFSLVALIMLNSELAAQDLLFVDLTVNHRFQGDTVALGEQRYGVNEYLTVGGRAEISGAAKLASATMMWSPRGTGIINAGLGVSDSGSGSGSSWLIGYQFQTRGYSVSAQATGTSKHFANVGMQPFYAVPKTQVVINGGWRSSLAGSFGAALVHTDYHNAVSRDIVTLNHSKTFFGRYYFSLYANYVKDDQSDFSLGLNVSTSFGSRRNASANILQNRRASQLRMQMQSTLPNGPGIGYRLGKTIGAQERFDGRFTGQTDYGRYGIDVDRFGSSTSVRTSASGSIAWLANRPYFAREINDGFAVARVGDIGDVRVYVENQEVGRSDKDGRLLLPRLRPYEINRIRIEPIDLPFSAEIQTVSIEVAPAFRSGIVIDFPVTTSSFALLSARLPNGEPVPGGATVHLSGKEQTTIVGLDGAIYATGPAGVTDLQVEWSSQTCHFTIELPAQTETLAHLGEFECRPVTQ